MSKPIVTEHSRRGTRIIRVTQDKGEYIIEQIAEAHVIATTPVDGKTCSRSVAGAGRRILAVIPTTRGEAMRAMVNFAFDRWSDTRTEQSRSALFVGTFGAFDRQPLKPWDVWLREFAAQRQTPSGLRLAWRGNTTSDASSWLTDEHMCLWACAMPPTLASKLRVSRFASGAGRIDERTDADVLPLIASWQAHPVSLAHVCGVGQTFDGPAAHVAAKRGAKTELLFNAHKLALMLRAVNCDLHVSPDDALAPAQLRLRGGNELVGLLMPMNPLTHSRSPDVYVLEELRSQCPELEE